MFYWSLSFVPIKNRHNTTFYSIYFTRQNTGAAKPKLMLPVILNVPLKRTSEALKPIERTWVEEVSEV